MQDTLMLWSREEEGYLSNIGWLRWSWVDSRMILANKTEIHHCCNIQRVLCTRKLSSIPSQSVIRTPGCVDGRLMAQQADVGSLWGKGWLHHLPVSINLPKRMEVNKIRRLQGERQKQWRLRWVGGINGRMAGWLASGNYYIALMISFSAQHLGPGMYAFFTRAIIE